MKIAFCLLASMLITAILSPAAYAAAGQGSPSEQGGSGGGPREACRQDAQTFCQGVQPGGGRILDCLKDHYKEISDGCYEALQNITSRGGPANGGSAPPSNAGQ